MLLAWRSTKAFSIYLLGLGGKGSHKGFLDRANELRINVMPGAANRSNHGIVAYCLRGGRSCSTPRKLVFHQHESVVSDLSFCHCLIKILGAKGFHSTEPALCNNFDCFEAWKTAAATGFKQGLVGMEPTNQCRPLGCECSSWLCSRLW